LKSFYCKFTVSTELVFNKLDNKEINQLINIYKLSIYIIYSRLTQVYNLLKKIYIKTDIIITIFVLIKITILEFILKFLKKEN
jgi:hypothetical protein